MFLLKAFLMAYSIAWCAIAILSAAPEDEPLQMLFDSFMPNSFLEKPVATKNSKDSGASDAKSSKTVEIIKTAEAMVSGLRNLMDGLNSPDNGDCKFTCPNGVKPKHLPGFRPVPNGCGTHGIKADTSDLPGITECCNQHDICYGTCNSGQSECDTEFNRCMSAACEKTHKEGGFKSDQEIKDCRALGATFYLATASMGCEFYREAQRSACLCDPSLEQGARTKNSAEKEDTMEKIRRHNSQIRARDLKDRNAKVRKPGLDEESDDAIDMSNSMFDLPEAIDHEDL